MHGGSLQTRGGDWFGSLPLGTRGVLVLNVGLYVLCLVFGYDAMHEVCMSPTWVLHQMQVYRIFTAPLFHGGIIHLAFNMTAFVPMAISLERLLGTVQFLHIVGLFITLSGCFHVAVAVVFGTMGFNAMHECAIGFSGVVFGVIVVDTHLSAVARRSVFGFFAVPAAWYPLSLLLFLQVALPTVSFAGHACGLLVGLAYVNGYLNQVLLRQNTVGLIEAQPVFERLVRNQSFVPGGVSADASPSTGTAAFPAFLSASGDAGGLLGNREHRRWWQMPTFASRGAPGSGEAFVASGRGRTSANSVVASAAAATATVSGAPSAKEAAAAAAEQRAGHKVALPIRNTTVSATREDPDSEMESMETDAASLVTAATGGLVNAGERRDEDDATLDVLLEMGFAPDEARAALLAAGGDVAGAVDALSGQHE